MIITWQAAANRLLPLVGFLDSNRLHGVRQAEASSA